MLYPGNVHVVGAFEFPAGYVVVGSDHLYVYRQGAPEQPAWEVPLAYPAGVHTLEVLRFEEAQRWAVWYAPERD